MLKNCIFALSSLFLSVVIFGQEQPVSQIKITSKQSVDTSSLKSIVDDLTGSLTNNDDKAVAVYNWMLFNLYHRQYPSEKGGVAALKVINTYGWSLCGGLHTIESALWKELGWKWRYMGWPGHTTAEAFYDGQWHFLDVFLKFYTWKEKEGSPNKRTIASQEDISNDHDLVMKNLVFNPEREVYYFKGNEFKVVGDAVNWGAPAFLVCRDNPKGIIEGVTHNKNNGSPEGWAGITFKDDKYSTNVDLGLYTRMELSWNREEGAHWWKQNRKDVPSHSCGDRDFRNSPGIGLLLEPYRSFEKGRGRSFSTGHFIWEPVIDDKFLSTIVSKENVKVVGGKLSAIDSGKPAYIEYSYRLPYVLSRGSVQVGDSKEGQISMDGGKNWKPVNLMALDDFIGGTYAGLLRLPILGEVSTIKLNLTFQHNRGSQMFLVPGKNDIKISVADASSLKDKKLVVTIYFSPGNKTKSFEEFANSGKEIAKSHNVSWSDTVYYVRKELTNKDFKNNQFELPLIIGTKKGSFAAYPRMVAIDREVIAEGGTATPIMDKSEEYKMADDEVELSLPYPFHFGIAMPVKEKEWPTKEINSSATFLGVSSSAGEYFENYFIKTLPKEPNKAWVALVKVGLPEMASFKDVKEFQLELPVIRGHNKAKVKIGVYAVTGDVAHGQAIKMDQIKGALGSFVLPVQPDSKDYEPAKGFSIALGKSLKGLLKDGQKDVVLAIKVIPERAIDDGYTVRADFALEGFKLKTIVNVKD